MRLQKRKMGGPAKGVFCSFGQLFGIVLLSSSVAFASGVVKAESCDSFLSCCDQGGKCRQFYLSGIVGADFATFDKLSGNPTTVPNQSIFTGGAAAGVRYLRDNGALRLEFEGRGRDQVSATAGDAVNNITTRATDGWSTMVNVWRDYKPYDSFGLYAGGGIGAGGYRFTIGGNGIGSLVSGNDRISNFAWQAGGGLFYEISKRATVDLGYRFFSISESTADWINVTSPVTTPTNFAASELLLQLRIYEPFRGWRR